MGKSTECCPDIGGHSWGCLFRQTKEMRAHIARLEQVVKVQRETLENMPTSDPWVKECVRKAQREVERIMKGGENGL